MPTADVSLKAEKPEPREAVPGPRTHPRTIGWFGTTSVAMGGINQSLFLIGALFAGQGTIPGQGSAAVVLLIVGLLLSWAATPGWTELILMYPNRVGGIAATCAEAFRPYSPILANLTGVCYWWGWVPTCGLTALLSASAINQWYLPWFPVSWMATLIVVVFTVVNLCGVKWVMRLAMPVATASAALAFLSAVLPIFGGSVDWHRAFSFHLTVPFPGWFGQVTSVMAGLYLVGFAAPAFEQAACHVGEMIDPNKNVPRAMFTSAAMASLYFIILPVIWLGTLGPEPLANDLATVLGPTFAPLFGGAAKATAIWFMMLNMFHGTIAPLAGASRTLAQLAEDGLLPEFLALRSRTDAPWVATVLTAAMSIAFLWIGDPVWLIAAANLTYLIGIGMPNIAVWLLRRDHPEMSRPYRAPKGTIMLGVLAAGVWGLTTVLGFEQFGLPTVLVGVAFAYSGSVLYAWRKVSDRRKQGLSLIPRTLHVKLTGAMLLVLLLDGAGYLIAVDHVPKHDTVLVTLLADIFVLVALLTISVGLILPGMIAHSAVELSQAAEDLVSGTLGDFTKSMDALAAGDLQGVKADFKMVPLVVRSKDELGDMALSFNRLQEQIGRAAVGLKGAREGLSEARGALTDTNERLRLAERKVAEQEIARLRNEHAMVLNTVSEGVHWVNCDGKINYENPASAKMLGYDPAELIGKPAHDTMHYSRSDGSHFPVCECSIYSTLRDGVSRRVKDEVFWRKDGTSFPVDYSCTPIRSEDGGVLGVVVVFIDITERKKVEAELEKANSQLRDASRKAGMAEVANNVLHNVGNVMNSINVSSNLAMEKISGSQMANLDKAVALMEAHGGDLAGFLTHDPKGVKILPFLRRLTAELRAEQQDVQAELRSLRSNIEHVNGIVTLQQNFAKVSGVLEVLPVVNLVEDALRMNTGSLERHHIQVVREYSEVPPALVDKHKTLQILINLIQNAKHALEEQGHSEKQLTMRVGMNGNDRIKITVSDNGIGIEPGNVARIFAHGFTTRKDGHGFGLHSGALAAQEMGGSLTAQSEGLGRGASFKLELPYQPQN